MLSVNKGPTEAYWQRREIRPGFPPTHSLYVRELILHFFRWRQRDNCCCHGYGEYGTDQRKSRKLISMYLHYSVESRVSRYMSLCQLVRVRVVSKTASSCHRRSDGMKPNPAVPVVTCNRGRQQSRACIRSTCSRRTQSKDVIGVRVQDETQTRGQMHDWTVNRPDKTVICPDVPVTHKDAPIHNQTCFYLYTSRWTFDKNSLVSRERPPQIQSWQIRLRVEKTSFESDILDGHDRAICAKRLVVCRQTWTMTIGRDYEGFSLTASGCQSNNLSLLKNLPWKVIHHANDVPPSMAGRDRLTSRSSGTGGTPRKETFHEFASIDRRM